MAHFSKKTKSEQFPELFLLKNKIKIKGVGLCHNIHWSSKPGSDIQNRHRCTIQQLSKAIQMELGKNSGTEGQGSGKASCARTGATECGGEMHNANTITGGKTLSIRKAQNLTKIVIAPGKTHNH